MLIHEIVRIGFAEAVGEAKRVFARAWLQVTDDPNDTEPLGDLAMAGSLGVTSIPADPSEDGASARAVLLRGVSGTVGFLVAAFDSRISDIVGLLGKGDTCLHGTGPNHGSRLFMLEQAVELVLTSGIAGDSKTDVIVQIDRQAGSAKIRIAGHHAELSEANGLRIDVAGGQASIEMKGNRIWLRADNVLLGSNPTAPVANAAASPAATPVPSVLVPPA